MALSAPRSYTRGYTLPLKVLLEPKPGSLASARSLALLTNSSAASLPVRVVLVRRTTHQESYKGKRREKQELSTAVAVGSCWVAPGYRQTASSKTIDCEIKLKKDLIPSFEYGGLKVDVSIIVSFLTKQRLIPIYSTLSRSCHLNPKVSLPLIPRLSRSPQLTSRSAPTVLRAAQLPCHLYPLDASNLPCLLRLVHATTTSEGYTQMILYDCINLLES